MPFSKADLRREMRARLRALQPTARAEASLAICETIGRQPPYLQAHTVALFDAMPDEPQLESLWELAPRRFVYPRIDGAELLLIEVPDRTALRVSEAGARFREPALDAAHIVDPAAVDLILVPGLAFTRDGHRLGRGGGFYDRLLARLPSHCGTLGVCFQMQLLDDLPREGHDRSVDGVITEAKPAGV